MRYPRLLGLLALVLCFALLGWSQETAKPTAPANQKQSSEDIEKRACPAVNPSHKADTDKTQHPTPEPPADKALIYVVRPTMMGNKVQTKFAVDGHFQGINRGDNYFFFTLEPGEHFFCSMAENKSALALTVEAGKTYFFQQKITMGFVKARNHLEAITPEAGKVALTKTHLSTYSPHEAEGPAEAKK